MVNVKKGYIRAQNSHFCKSKEVIDKSISNKLFTFIFTCREFSTCKDRLFQLNSNKFSIFSLFLFFYFNFFSLSSYFFLLFSSLFLPSSDRASLLNSLDPHPSSKTNKNHHQSITLFPKSTQNPTSQKTHLPNPSTHSNLPVKLTKNHPKSNQITKPRSSSTLSQDQSFKKGERARENGRKEKKKKGKREKEVMKMERKKEKKNLKKRLVKIFLFNEKLY